MHENGPAPVEPDPWGKPNCKVCGARPMERHSDYCREARPRTSAERYWNLGVGGDVCGPFAPETGHFGRGPIAGEIRETREEAVQDMVAFGVGIYREPVPGGGGQLITVTEARVGIGPGFDYTPAQSLPTSALARKELPLASGLLDYFPAALIAVAGLSRVGNEQHNPGQPMHWNRGKSGDEADALLRHLVDRGTVDTDGIRHSVKVAWRALALLQKELETEGLAPLSRGSR